jgi:hypothetical protein
MGAHHFFSPMCFVRHGFVVLKATGSYERRCICILMLS